MEPFNHWDDERAVCGRLAALGFDEAACRAKAALLAKAAAALNSLDRSGPAAASRGYLVPGRIEVLGKHTDYAGGRSLVAAAGRGFCLLARPRADARFRMVDALLPETIEFDLQPDLVPAQSHWSNYPMTVARRLTRNFPGLRTGVDVAFASDLPPAAGMSSSSALMVAVFLILADANDIWHRPEFLKEFEVPHVLAGYLGTIENGQSYGALAGDRGVGTFGGSEDHTAILCGQAGRLSQYSYCPVRFERNIDLPSHCTFAIGSSGIVAHKAGLAKEKYNAASQLAGAVAQLWRERTGRDEPHLAAAIHSGPDAIARLRALVNTPELSARLEHFFAENEEILPAAGDALAAGDLPEFGRLVDRSERGAEELLGNQIPETIFLAASARRLGALAASAFGAGFGGSVWALVEKAKADDFLAHWSRDYAAAHPGPAAAAEFFLTTAGPAAKRI